MRLSRCRQAWYHIYGDISLKPFVAVGFQSKELIVQSGLRLGDVDQYPTIDVTIDGADE